MNRSFKASFLVAAVLAQAVMAHAAGTPAPANNGKPQAACSAGSDSAVVNWTKPTANGDVEFKVTTHTDTYQGVAHRSNPKHSMEKQVLALTDDQLEGRTSFCLHD